MIDYFYFSSMELEKRKKILEGNFIKRNLHIMRQIEAYDKDFQNIKLKKFNSEQLLNKIKGRPNNSLMEIIF